MNDLLIDMMKENMLMEKIRNKDYIKFLKEQVHIFTIEQSHENKQICCLIKLINKNVKRVRMETMSDCNHQTLTKYWK